MTKTSRTRGAWVAIDKHGTLRLFYEKPIKLKWFVGWSKRLMNLDPKDFSDVTWENSLQKVEIIIRKDGEQ